MGRVWGRVDSCFSLLTKSWAGMVICVWVTCHLSRMGQRWEASDGPPGFTWFHEQLSDSCSFWLVILSIMLSWKHDCRVLIIGPWSHTGAKDVHLVGLGMCSPLPWQFKLKSFMRSQTNPEPGVGKRLRLLGGCKNIPCRLNPVCYPFWNKVLLVHSPATSLFLQDCLFVQQWENWGLTTKLYFLALSKKFTDFWIPTTGKLLFSWRNREGQQIMAVWKIFRPSSNSGLQAVKAHSAHLSEPF